MNDLLQPTSRRTLLQRGLMLVAGALGMQVTERQVRGDPAPVPRVTPAGGETLRFYARRLHIQPHGQRPGEMPVANGRLESRCALSAEPGGKPVGEFAATGFHSEPASHSNRTAAGSVELQTFQVETGSLFGVGPGHLRGGRESVHAILGGTGRFAGARGTYVIRESRTLQGEPNLEFVLNLIS